MMGVRTGVHEPSCTNEYEPAQLVMRLMEFECAVHELDEESQMMMAYKVRHQHRSLKNASSFVWIASSLAPSSLVHIMPCLPR